jgi:hypothetical protein
MNGLNYVTTYFHSTDRVHWDHRQDMLLRPDVRPLREDIYLLKNQNQ